MASESELRLAHQAAEAAYRAARKEYDRLEASKASPEAQHAALLASIDAEARKKSTWLALQAVISGKA